MKENPKPKASVLIRLKEWLQKLSFRTGMIVLLCCIPFYIISFAQMALPIPIGLKGALWVIFFGLAKTAQYGGLTILGAKGFHHIRDIILKRKRAKGKTGRTKDIEEKS